MLFGSLELGLARVLQIAALESREAASLVFIFAQTNLHLKRRNTGLERANAEEKVFAYQVSESEEVRIRERLAKVESVRSIAIELSTSRMTVMRIRDAVAA